MMAPNPRIFIVDFDLVGYSGHSFNQVLGFCEAARERGLESRVYVCRTADPEVAKELNASAILPSVPWNVSKDVMLGAVVDAQRTLKPLWEDLANAGISRQDIVVFTSSRAQVIAGVGQWLATLTDEARPSVFFRFFRTDFFDARLMSFSKAAWAYHFAARILAALPGGERVFLTVNNQKAVRYLERLTLRSSFFLPVPKYYGPVVDRSEVRAVGVTTIYVHVNRPDFAPELVRRVVTAILRSRSDVKFTIRFCRYAFPTSAAQEAAVRGFSGHNVEFLPGGQSPAEYLAAIERADMVLLPYDPVEYHDIVSGIFCEAAAMGKVTIIPAETWMADHILEARAAGVLFQKRSVDGIVTAVEEALQNRVPLQAEAHRLGPVFREENSCISNLDKMIELSGKEQDMRLPYVPLTDCTTALGSQHFFCEGWSLVDAGFGIWSDGQRAEISFSIKPGARSLVFSALVYPFLARHHSQLAVALTANNVPVAEWSFDASRAADRNWSWRHVQLPVAVSANGDIQIVMSILSPASPMSLGLSADSRSLGIAIRKFSLEAEAHAPQGDRDERRTMLGRLKGRVRRLLKRALSPSE